MNFLRPGLGGLLLISLSALAQSPLHGSDDGRVTVHEWGTFTSIAGSDGRAVDWLPLRGSTDLPCFVERLGLDFKGTLAGTLVWSAVLFGGFELMRRRWTALETATI